MDTFPTVIFPKLDHTRPVVYVVEYMEDCSRYKRYSFDKNEILNFVNFESHQFVAEGFSSRSITPKHPNILFKEEYTCDGESIRKVKLKEISCLEGDYFDGEEKIYMYSVQSHIRGAGKFEAYTRSRELAYKTNVETNKRILNDHQDHIWAEKFPFYKRYICHVSNIDNTSFRETISYAYTELEGRCTDEESTPRYRATLSTVKLLEK